MSCLVCDTVLQIEAVSRWWCCQTTALNRRCTFELMCNPTAYRQTILLYTMQWTVWDSVQYHQTIGRPNRLNHYSSTTLPMETPQDFSHQFRWEIDIRWWYSSLLLAYIYSISSSHWIFNDIWYTIAIGLLCVRYLAIFVHQRDPTSVGLWASKESLKLVHHNNRHDVCQSTSTSCIARVSIIIHCFAMMSLVEACKISSHGVDYWRRKIGLLSLEFVSSWKDKMSYVEHT